MSEQQKEMSFLDHLEVLRWHLVRSSIAVLSVTVVAFVFFKKFIFETIVFGPTTPEFYTYKLFCSISQKFNTEGLCIKEFPFTLQSTEVGENFSIHIWTSITAGFIIAFSYVLWEIWKFISPGLYKKERKNAVAFIFISSMLFFAGVTFGYFVITPISINFFGSYSVSETIQNDFKIASYIAMMKSAVLASGVMFELPVVIYFLSKMGIVTPTFLKTYRKHAVVVVLILAAAITPPDVISQIIVTIPILILYEVSIVITSVVYKRANKDLIKTKKKT